MNAVHLYPWLTWSWLLACIARIQRGSASGVLKILEGLCRSSFFTMDDVRVSRLLSVITPRFHSLCIVENGHSHCESLTQSG